MIHFRNQHVTHIKESGRDSIFKTIIVYHKTSGYMMKNLSQIIAFNNYLSIQNNRFLLA